MGLDGASQGSQAALRPKARDEIAGILAQKQRGYYALGTASPAQLLNPV